MELTELNLSEEQLSGVNSYLDEQVRTAVQKETDKVRTKYNKEIKTYETTIQELQGKIPREKSEEELGWEKEKAEFEKEKMQFNLQKQLSDKGLDSKLAQYLNVQGVENLETYLNELTEVIGKPTTNSYKPKSHVTATNLTKADFQKMNYNERINLYNTNKELYDSLSK